MREAVDRVLHFTLTSEPRAREAPYAVTPLVHIILVNFNGLDDTRACVESCLQLTHERFQIVIVDNASADGSGSTLAADYADEDRVHVILNEANLGFAGGNNTGIAHALEHGADFVWLLNNDTFVDAQALSELVAAAAEHPEAGMFGSKVYFADRPETLWFAGGFIRDVCEGSVYHRGLEEEDLGQYDEAEVVDYVTGCSLLVSTGLVRTIGTMSEDYFLYWEEVDWCDRSTAAGRPCLYVPASKVWHKVGASLGATNTPLQIRYDARNRLIFYWRNRRGAFPRVLWWFNRQIFAFTLSGYQGEHARLLLRAEADFFLGKRGPIRVR